MSPVDSLFYVIVLIMSVVVHEFAHGYVAYLYGDQTARLQGRLTLNPIKHLDLFGSIVLPLLLIISNAGFVIGWARPVPYNPDNLTDKKWGTIWVSIAGVLANLSLAFIFGMLIRIAPHLGIPEFVGTAMHPFYRISMSIVLINIVLAVFNLLPIPPLDGSKILFSFLPARLHGVQDFLERWGIFVLLLFVISVWKFFSPFIMGIFTLLTGMN